MQRSSICKKPKSDQRRNFSLSSSPCFLYERVDDRGVERRRSVSTYTAC